MFSLSKALSKFLPLIFIGFGVSSQSIFTHAETVSVDHTSDRPTVLLLYQDGSLQELDLDTGKKGSLREYGLSSVDVAALSKQIFGLVSPGTGIFVPGKSQIVQIDLASNETWTEYYGENVYDIEATPDGQFIVVNYFSEPLKTVRDVRSDTRSAICVVTVGEHECRDVGLPVQSYRIVWAGTEKFIVDGMFDDTAYIMDLPSLAIEVSPYYISDAVEIGDNNLLVDLAGVSRLYGDLGYMDLKTLSFKPYDLFPDSIPLNDGAYELSVSPDGQYFSFRVGNRHYFLEKETGALVAEADNLMNVQWLSNTQIIARHYPILGSLPQEIVLYDIPTNAMRTIGSFAESVYVVVE